MRRIVGGVQEVGLPLSSEVFDVLDLTWIQALTNEIVVPSIGSG